MKSKRSVLLVLSLALACAAAIVSGCGASSTVDPVADAASVTSLTRGTAVAGTISIAARGQAITMPISGAFDLRGRRGSLRVDLSQLSAATGGKLGQGVMQEREIYPDLYMSAPFLTKGVPGHKQWIKIDVEAAAKRATGLDLSQLTAQNGPSDELQQLRASGGAHEVGTEYVRGVMTTHYHGTVDLRKLADRVPPSQRQATKQGVERLITLTGASTYPADVWIDAQRHVRRMRMALSMTINGQRANMSISMDLFNFGIRPAVTAPPASQVFDATPAPQQ